MGYSTDFSGGFDITPPLSTAHKAYLLSFASTRRMKRDAAKCEAMADADRERVGLPVGLDGAYFTGGLGMAGQDHDASVVNSNDPPGTPDCGLPYPESQKVIDVAIGNLIAQPGLWCQWTPNEEGTQLVWDEGEKFYHYEEWLKYLVAHFLKPWGYVLNGECHWQGGETDDRGTIYVRDNEVEAVQDEIVNRGPSWAQEPLAAG